MLYIAMLNNLSENS